MVFYTTECEAVISGPLNSEEEVPGPPLIVLEMNETHPARVRCKATCLDQQGTSTYNPAMAVIVTSQEQFIKVYGARDNLYSWDGLHFEVHTGNVSYCDAQKNYTMEYEYLITSNSSKINHSVVMCGVNTSHVSPPYSSHTCWGQSHGIIRSEVDTHQDPTNPSSNEATYCCCAANSSTLLIYPLIITSTIVIIIVFVIILLLTVGFLRLRYQSRIRIAPQTVELIKMEQPVASESAAVREKETSFSEKSDSSHSSAQAQLQEKLPDTISSRSKTL